MSRLSAALALAATLGLGLASGMLIGQGEPLSALPTQRAETSPAAPEVAGLPGSEEAIYQSLARQYEQFHPINRTFELTAKVASRAVVHVVALKRDRTGEGRTRRTYEESGSGVIVRSDHRSGRFILTNNHVIAGADPSDIRLSLQDGRVFEPVEILADEDSDVAVLTLPADDLPTARLGDSDDAVPGTWVLALGSPFGLTHSVSQGIISARGRQERDLYDNGVQNQDFLQTDAAINPGNSGGPLINLKGEVIGINTAIASHGGGNEGVGYSIPINLAKWAMNQLLEDGKVRRGGIGISLQDISVDDFKTLDLDRPRGTKITDVADDSPAKRSGILPDDVIVRYNGVEVRNTWHLINMISTTPIGQEIDLVVVRDGRRLGLRVVVADFDALDAKRPPRVPLSPEGYLQRP